MWTFINFLEYPPILCLMKMIYRTHPKPTLPVRIHTAITQGLLRRRVGQDITSKEDAREHTIPFISMIYLSMSFVLIGGIYQLAMFALDIGTLLKFRNGLSIIGKYAKSRTNMG